MLWLFLAVALIAAVGLYFASGRNLSPTEMSFLESVGWAVVLVAIILLALAALGSLQDS